VVVFQVNSKQPEKVEGRNLMNQDRPALCQGCQDYYGLGRPGDRLVCGIHPYGWSDGGSCPDWRGKGAAPRDTVEQKQQATWFHVRSVSDLAAIMKHDGVNRPPLTQEQREVPVLVGRGVLADFAAMLNNELSCQIEDTILITLRGLREEASAASRAYNGSLVAPSAEPLCPQNICPVCYHELSEYCSLNCQEPVEPSTYRDFV